MEEIFSKYAPAYWEKGIPVMPIKTGDKAAIIDAWQQYQDSMPSEATQSRWLSTYKVNNIGVPLGPQSQMVVIDIDALDPKVEEVIRKTLPKSPWIRVGQKGCVMAYRFNDEKNEDIYDDKGVIVVQILSAGKQVVLPPSIHPKTQKPYTENVPLLDVWADLPRLPDDVVNKLRAALSTVIKLGKKGGGNKQKTSFSYNDLVSVGGRDNAITSHAGTLSREITLGKSSLAHAMMLMREWCETAVQNVGDDPIDMQKGINKIVEFLKKDVERGWHLPPNWDEHLTPEAKLQLGLDFDEDVKEWTEKQLNDYIIDEFNKCTGADDPARHEVVKYVLNKISKSPHLSPTAVDRILLVLQKTSGFGIPVASYRKELKSLSNGPIQGENHTEIAAATVEIFKERRGELRFHQGQFWNWAGNRWVKIHKQELLKIISEDFGTLMAAKKFNDHDGITKVLQNTIPQELTAVPQDGVNFANGFLTKDLRLIEHQPEHGMTYVLEMSYKPELAGKCPKFFEYLRQSWGHHEDCMDKIAALQEAMAITVFGMASSYQRAFLLYGPGGSGKSVLLEVIDRLVPDEAKCAIPPGDWGENFLVSELSGKLLNIAGELKKDGVIEGATFKNVVAGEKIQVRGIYGKPFTLQSRAANWFASNYYPKSTDTSNGFNRRWLIFEFDKILDEKDVIRDYGKIIADDEQEAIVAWAIEALPRMLERQNYTLPKSHLEAVKMMSLKNSTLRQWLEESTEYKEGAKITERELYKSFWNWVSFAQNGKVPTHTAFKVELIQTLMEDKRLSLSHGPDGEIYNGLALKKKNT